MDDIAFLDATDLARKIRDREISSRKLLDRYLDRIGRLNESINAVVTLDIEGARRRADEADAELAAGRTRGPLHGLPITVKDTLETQGIRTTAGFPPLAEHVPAKDAVVVERAVAAGAIVFGKSNNPMLASDYQSYNAIFGLTRNPWDPERTPGGSSGGSAAALAAGFTAFEIGSDIAGSIRVPAHWCGVYGHRPTHGLIPGRGHIPGPPGAQAEVDLAVMGPMARSARDLALLLGAMAGPARDAAVAWKLEMPAPRARKLQDYRVGVWMDEADFPIDTTVRTPLLDALGTLRAAGARIDFDARPKLRMAEVVDIYLRLLWPIMTSGYPEETFSELAQLASTLPENAGHHLAYLARYGTARYRDWLRANEVRAQMRNVAAEFFASYDVLLMPVNQLPAIVHDHSEPQVARTVEIDGRTHQYFDLLSWIALATALNLPATSMPVGRTTDGLPVGMQIVGPHLEDFTAIDFAMRAEEVLGGFVPPPAFSS
jgi:amidase